MFNAGSCVRSTELELTNYEVNSDTKYKEHGPSVNAPAKIQELHIKWPAMGSWPKGRAREDQSRAEPIQAREKPRHEPARARASDQGRGEYDV